MMYHADTDTLKLTDFGIARLTDSSKTKTGMVLGTPSYMSPEQLAGKKIEGRSDLFSLAVSLYQMLSGKLPFEGESMAQLMFKIANDAPGDIRAFNPGVPQGLVSFLERALAKNPQARFQTGEEFSGALRLHERPGAEAAAAAAWTLRSSAWTLTDLKITSYRSGHGALAQRGSVPPTRRTAWWCSPTAWAASTREKSRAAWRPR
jgi:serine/threonine-protein kinase